MKVQFSVNFDSKLRSKNCDFVDLRQYTSKFASIIFALLDCISSCGQLVQKVSENRVVCIFVYQANEPGLTGDKNLRSFSIQSEPQKLKLIKRIAIAAVILPKNPIIVEEILKNSSKIIAKNLIYLFQISFSICCSLTSSLPVQYKFDHQN